MIAVLFLWGCVASSTPVEATITQTISSGQTVTNTPELIRKSYPTLSNDIANKKLQELLINNANCRLPCWWGITPRKTTWEEARTFLATFTQIIGEPILLPDGSIYITAQLPIQKELGTLDHTYKIKNNIVVGVDAYVFDWSPFLYLSNVLNEYGSPDGIFITTYRYDENGRRPYIVYVIYENFGVLLMYSGGNVENVGDKVQNCFENLYSPFVYIWSVDDEPLTVNQVKDKYFSSESMPYPISLEQATGMSINTFYETFKKPSSANCLVTPAELWPEP